jgi:transposase-like protein
VGAAGGWQNAGKESAIMAKQRYSKEYQDEACKLVIEQGCSQKQTAHKLGVSIVTLREWLKKRDLLRNITAPGHTYQVAAVDLTKAAVQLFWERSDGSRIGKSDILLHYIDGSGNLLPRNRDRFWWSMALSTQGYWLLRRAGESGARSPPHRPTRFSSFLRRILSPSRNWPAS